MLAEQEVDLIRRIPIFGAIPPAMQKLLCFSSERLTYEPGQVLFREGEAPDAAYIVIEGDVEISVRGAGGPLALNRLGRNAILGEAAIFGDMGTGEKSDPDPDFPRFSFQPISPRFSA